MIEPRCIICGNGLPIGKRCYCSNSCAEEGARRRQLEAREGDTSLSRVRRGLYPVTGLEFQTTPAERLLREYQKRGFRSDWVRLQQRHETENL